MAKQEKRFVKVYEQGVLEGVTIWADTETGVQYIRAFAGENGGFTLLVGPDGKPLLAQQPIEEWEEKKKREKAERSGRRPWG